MLNIWIACADNVSQILNLKAINRYVWQRYFLWFSYYLISKAMLLHENCVMPKFTVALPVLPVIAWLLYNFNHLLWCCPIKLPSTKILTFYYISLSWSCDHFAYVANNNQHRAVLLSMWWLINALYIVWEALSATAALLVTCIAFVNLWLQDKVSEWWVDAREKVRRWTREHEWAQQLVSGDLCSTLMS